MRITKRFFYRKGKELGLEYNILHTRPLLGVTDFNSHNFTKEKLYVCVLYTCNIWCICICVYIYIHMYIYRDR